MGSMHENKNKMGKWGATSYLIGNVIGSGVFISPTSILKNASSIGMSLVIWVLSAVISILGAYCYVELGTSIRISGADFAYLSYVKWKAIAFAFMSMGTIYQYPLTLAIQGDTFSEYIIQGLKLEFVDYRNGFIAKKLIGFTLIWLLLFLNFFSLKFTVARFQIAASLAKLFSTSTIIATGAYYLIIKGQTQNLAQPFANTTLEPGHLVNAFYAGLFSYDGWDILNFGVEEVENPRLSMSFAIIVGMSSIAVIYLAMQVSFFVVLTVPEFSNSDAVAMTFAQKSLGVFQYSIPFFISILLIGSLNGTLFTASRYFYSASRERQFPAFISCRNIVNDSPRAALLLHVILAFMFTFAGNITEMISYVGFSQWFLRALSISALLYIRLWDIPVRPDAIRTPIICPIIFLCVCLVLVVVTILQSFWTAFGALIMLGVAFLVWVVFLWEKGLRRFNCYLLGADRVNRELD